MQLTLDSSTLEKLLHHATSAAHIVGHLDHPIAAGPLGEHVDAVAHGLSELLGKARTLAERDAAAPDVAHDGAPMLALDAGGAP